MFAGSAAAQDVAPPATSAPVSESGIPFKQDEAYERGLLGRVILATTFALGLAVAVAWLIRRGIFRNLPGASGASTIRLREYKRLTPRLTIYVVDIEEKRVVLAQSGDHLIEVRFNNEKTNDAALES